MLVYILLGLLVSISLGFGSSRKFLWDTAAKMITFILKSTESLNHNYGRFIGDLFISLLLIWSGFDIANKLNSTEEHPWYDFWFWGRILLVIGAKINRYFKFSIASGKEFDIFFNFRVESAKARASLNTKYAPHIKPSWDYRNNPVISNYVEGILSNHLDFLHQTLKLGFSTYGKDSFSVSLIVYDPKKQMWHNWRNFYPTTIKPKDKRKGSVWPKSKQDFKLSESFYNKGTKQGLFDIQNFKPESGYQSVLSIPFYFRQDARGNDRPYEVKDEIFALLCYTTSNPKSFNSIDTSSYLRYFAQEVSLIERMVIRIYKGYNF